MSTYDDPQKEIAWESYWQGYKLGYGVESYDRSDEATARERFERWYTNTYGE